MQGRQAAEDRRRHAGGAAGASGEDVAAPAVETVAAIAVPQAETPSQTAPEPATSDAAAPENGADAGLAEEVSPAITVPQAAAPAQPSACHGPPTERCGGCGCHLCRANAAAATGETARALPAPMPPSPACCQLARQHRASRPPSRSKSKPVRPRTRHSRRRTGG